MRLGVKDHKVRAEAVRKHASRATRGTAEEMRIALEQERDARRRRRR